MKEQDIILILNYFSHLEDKFKPEYVHECEKRGIEPNGDLYSATAVRCLWSDYILATEELVPSAPMNRIISYLIQREKTDFIENTKDVHNGLTASKEKELRESSTHIWAVCIRALGNTFFDFGIKKKKEEGLIDLEKIQKELKTSGVVEKHKPDDSLVTIELNGNEDLLVSLDFDLGPSGTTNIVTYLVKKNGSFSVHAGKSFKGENAEEKQYIERCCRKISHEIQSLVRREQA